MQQTTEQGKPEQRQQHQEQPKQLREIQELYSFNKIDEPNNNFKSNESSKKKVLEVDPEDARQEEQKRPPSSGQAIKKAPGSTQVVKNGPTDSENKAETAEVEHQQDTPNLSDEIETVNNVSGNISFQDREKKEKNRGGVKRGECDLWNVCT